jgi:plastocyanin
MTLLFVTGVAAVSALPAVPVAAQGTGAAVRMTEPSEERYAFTPDATTVPAGATVTWTNGTDAPHTVTSDTGAFGSSTLNEDQTFRFTFATPGTYAYHCTVHPYMHGTITVTAATGAGAGAQAAAPARAGTQPAQPVAPAAPASRLPQTGGGATGAVSAVAVGALAAVAGVGAALARWRRRR